MPRVRFWFDFASSYSYPAAMRILAAKNRGRLRGNTEAAQRLGIFGAPSFTVDEELFWGNDRLEEALEWAAR